MGNTWFWCMGIGQTHKEGPKQMLKRDKKIKFENQIQHFNEYLKRQYKDALFQLPSLDLLYEKCKGIK